ncbi:hypothetical protein [Acuticoccus mangrovi]|uniref:Uncharacterized protein n=1 Tax=Acuticoccus mangrovi TaxID=2796142 RepID=A0A934IDB6_9HYPH|nr:hypothetical protein [Acuticoccus mangrovi]MBJ3774453.1 hypothetical protein [Acuticoccus mangrovi]
MRNTFGALAALAILMILLVGPIFLAASNASDRGLSAPMRCGTEIGCDVSGPTVAMGS